MEKLFYWLKPQKPQKLTEKFKNMVATVFEIILQQRTVCKPH